MSFHSFLRNSKNDRKEDEEQMDISDVEEGIPRICRKQSQFFPISSGCTSSGTANSSEDKDSREGKQLGSGVHFENTQDFEGRTAADETEKQKWDAALDLLGSATPDIWNGLESLDSISTSGQKCSFTQMSTVVSGVITSGQTSAESLSISRNVRKDSNSDQKRTEVNNFTPATLPSNTNSNTSNITAYKTLALAAQQYLKQSNMSEKQLISAAWSFMNMRDKTKTFALPVSDKIAPGYSEIVKNKMALSDMKKKIARGEYPSLESFGEDIELIVNNCRLYNSRSSIFARRATAFWEAWAVFYKAALSRRSESLRTLHSDTTTTSHIHAITTNTTSASTTTAASKLTHATKLPVPAKRDVCREGPHNLSIDSSIWEQNQQAPVSPINNASRTLTENDNSNIESAIYSGIASPAEPPVITALETHTSASSSQRDNTQSVIVATVPSTVNTQTISCTTASTTTMSIPTNTTNIVDSITLSTVATDHADFTSTAHTTPTVPVPLDTQIEIMKFLAQHGDETYKTEAMRELMALAKQR
eukprot:gene11817-13713_t